MSDRKAVIKNADMAEDMQQDAVDCATQVRNGKFLQLSLQDSEDTVVVFLTKDQHKPIFEHR